MNAFVSLLLSYDTLIDDASKSLLTTVQCVSIVGSSCSAIRTSPISSAVEKNVPATVTVYIFPTEIPVGLVSRLGVFVVALYPPWYVTDEAMAAST